MTKTWKTKEVASELGITPSTVYRWVRFFDIVYRKHRNGPYEFEQKHLQQLQKIKQELEQGKQLEEVQLERRRPAPSKQSKPSANSQPSASRKQSTAGRTTIKSQLSTPEEPHKNEQPQNQQTEQERKRNEFRFELENVSFPPKEKMISPQSKNKESTLQTVKDLQENIHRLERKVEQKADEVVSAQMLIHRKEIDQLAHNMAQIEKRLAELEHNVLSTQPPTVQETHPVTRPSRKIFSLFSIMK